MTPRIILVSGCPGAGKTSVARPLAARLGFSLIRKDDIKEALFDAFEGPVGDLAFSNRVGAASWAVLWLLARNFPRAVLEANFRPHSDQEREQIASLAGEVLEIHCACPPEVARERYAARSVTPDRHPAHAVTALTDAHLAEYDRPLDIGEPIIVDTEGLVDLDALLSEVGTRLGSAPLTTAPATRRAVLMTGYPASGKSTLAASLAKALEFGLVSKDGMLDAVFTAMDFAAGDHLASLRSGRAAWAVFWRLARTCPDVVLDSNIKPTEPFEAAQARSLEGRIVDVHCDCSRDIVRRRYAERAAAFPRPALRAFEITEERLARYDGDLGFEHRLSVDTSLTVDLAAVTKAVRQAFDAGSKRTPS